ncbi:hypothetical protein [Desulfobacula sp.]|uniref:hypothetical protein n=1 Tax=Desulfobacula sp. TaxID=2593537 RepID=UPI002617C56D|nr:hypothetical protein [Desulfobacula sp.]
MTLSERINFLQGKNDSTAHGPTAEPDSLAQIWFDGVLAETMIKPNFSISEEYAESGLGPDFKFFCHSGASTIFD